ncbi:complement receptor type 2-like [Clarias gariepinus]
MAGMSWTCVLFAHFFAHLVVSDAGSTCGSPPVYPDKLLDERYAGKWEFNTGDRVVYKCALGYMTRTGDRFSFCQSGHWSPLELQCTRKKCGSAGEISNGRYKQMGNAFGDKAYAECNEGYVLQGEPVRECLLNGWSGDVPICVASHRPVTCEPLMNNKNATFYKIKDTYEPGDTLSYSCNDGFRLTGNTDFLICDTTGNWKPSQANCESKCQRPPTVPNAHTVYSNQRDYEPTTAMRFRCNHGYRMVRGPSTTYCRNGRWTDLGLVCEKKKCGSAGEIENGRYHYTGSLFGDTVTASCNEGYNLVGVSKRYCKAAGWDGRAPVCEVVQCPDPPRVPGAELFFDTSGIVQYGYVASYRCHFGQMIGASDIVCTKEGTWDAPAPQCEVTCPRPHIMFGVIAHGIRSVYRPRSSVRYMCSPGRRLSGPAVITCGTDGHWKPRLPHCVF